jgi:membrane-bound serine protease (ClpP class)
MTSIAETTIEADPKVVSAVRSTFRSTAEERGRDPDVAAAMVDSDLEVEGLVGRGELVSLTTSEAQEWGYTDGVASTRDEVLEQAGLAGAPVVEVAQTAAERFVRFITNPVLSGLFLMAGWLLIMGDLGSGGIGGGTALGAAFLAVFFWGHLLAGLAGWEDVALVVFGVLLLLIELLVVPGFGVFGILGLAALLGGSFLAMLGRDFDFVGTDRMVEAGIVVGSAFVGVVVLLVFFVKFLMRGSGPPGLVLRSQLASTTPATQRSTGWLNWFGDGGVLDADTRSSTEPRVSDGVDAEVEGDQTGEAAGVAVAAKHGLIGATGVALSDLRPSGVADIDGRRIDVVTDGEYIRAGELVEVMGDEGYRRVVRRPRE